MNKKELNEIKKNFNENSGFMTINNIAIGYIDAEKKVTVTPTRLFSLIPEGDGAILLNTLKKTITGTIGKNIVQYDFPKEAFEHGNAQDKLKQLLHSKLKDADLMKNYFEQEIIKINCDTAYAVIIANCTYSIIKHDKNNEALDESIFDYNFLISAFVPVNTGDGGLYYDAETATIKKMENTELILSKQPSDGFLFPAFTNRSPDPNSIMYYCHTPNKPNSSIVENLFECEYTMTPEHEEYCFRKILEEVVGEELDYKFIIAIGAKLIHLFEQYKNEGNPTLCEKQLYDILTDLGVSDERMEGFHASYEKRFGDNSLTIANLICNKNIVEVDGMSISFGKDEMTLIKPDVIDGRDCFVVKCKDTSIIVNGVSARMWKR